MKKIMSLFVILISLPFSIFAKDITVAVSMSSFDDNFLTIVRNAIKTKADAQGGVVVQFEDAKTDVAQQIQQVENFVSQGVDVIILNPVDTKGVKPMIKLAESANIPLVFVNRKPEIELGENMAYVGSDSKLAGTLQMEAIAEKLGGKGNVYVLMGVLSSEATRDRTAGVEEIVAKYPDMKVIDKQTAKFQRKEAIDVVTDWVLSGEKIDAIASNNDEMAIGAIMALKQSGKTDVVIAGIDGTPDAIEFMKKGDLSLTIFQDAFGQGEGALDAALKLVKGEKTEKDILVPYQVITPENYQDFIDANKMK